MIDSIVLTTISLSLLDVCLRAYWSGSKLVVHRVLESGEYELLLTREMQGDKTILLSQLHRCGCLHAIITPERK